MNPFKISLFVFVACSVLINCSPKIAEDTSPEPVTVVSSFSTAQIDAIAQKLFVQEKLPGMSIMVWKDGEYIFEKGYGFANVESEIPVDPRKTVFRIGSVSKPVTAALLGKLYEEGKLDLDADIRTYIPYFPEKRQSISTRQLAGHLGGIRHYRGLENFSTQYYSTVKEGLDIFMSDSLSHKPGSKLSYSSYGWNLLSAVLEGASGGQDFLSLMEDYVFSPLELKTMQAEIMNKKIDNKVSYYLKGDSGENVLAADVDNSYKWAGGGFIASAEDVVKFAAAHLQAGYLTDNTLEELFTGQQTNDGTDTNYGLGWRSGEDKKGRHWIGHSGGSVGGTTMMLVYPEEKIIVVTLVNLTRAKTGDLAFRLANQLFPTPDK